MKHVSQASAFELDHSGLAVDSGFAQMARALSALSPIDSEEKFNRYCQEACRVWAECFPEGLGHTSEGFPRLRDRVTKGDGPVIQTGWGGVVITMHDHPRVEKYLVIRRGGYLALEMHEKKDERLQVKEGAGLILWRKVTGSPLLVEALRPSCDFHLKPGMEHCLIGTENLLVFERSIDPKGMDQDLIFIFEPNGAAAAAHSERRE